jgi:hypothetical protein
MRAPLSRNDNFAPARGVLKGSNCYYLLSDMNQRRRRRRLLLSHAALRDLELNRPCSTWRLNAVWDLD